MVLLKAEVYVGARRGWMTSSPRWKIKFKENVNIPNLGLQLMSSRTLWQRRRRDFRLTPSFRSRGPPISSQWPSITKRKMTLTFLKQITISLLQGRPLSNAITSLRYPKLCTIIPLDKPPLQSKTIINQCWYSIRKEQRKLLQSNKPTAWAL